METWFKRSQSTDRIIVKQSFLTMCIKIGHRRLSRRYTLKCISDVLMFFFGLSPMFLPDRNETTPCRAPFCTIFDRIESFRLITITFNVDLTNAHQLQQRAMCKVVLMLDISSIPRTIIMYIDICRFQLKILKDKLVINVILYKEYCFLPLITMFC